MTRVTDAYRKLAMEHGSKLIDSVTLEPVVGPPEEIDADLPHVTHTGVLDIGGFQIHIYQLSNGQRIILAEDLERFIETLEGEGTVITEPAEKRVEQWHRDATEQAQERGICSKAFDRTHPYAEGYAHQKTKECVDWKRVQGRCPLCGGTNLSDPGHLCESCAAEKVRPFRSSERRNQKGKHRENQ